MILRKLRLFYVLVLVALLGRLVAVLLAESDQPSALSAGPWAKPVSRKLLATTIAAATQMKVITPVEFERVIVDSTVQEKAIAYPTDSRLLAVARTKLVRLAQRAGLGLKQTYEREGKRLRRRAGGYAHAKQFKRLRRVLKRQRTVLGRVLRDIERKMSELPHERQTSLRVWLERRWLLRAVARLGMKAFYALAALLVAGNVLGQPHAPSIRLTPRAKRWRRTPVRWEY